jgi:hypothetical protein
MSYKYSILAVTDTDKMFGNLSNVSIANAFRNIGQHFEAVAVGSKSEYVTLNSGPVRATGTIVVATGNMSSADYVVINGTTLTAETTPTTGVQFKVGSTARTTAQNLCNCINNNQNTLGVTATYANSTSSGGTITVTALAAGTVGNYAWSQSGSNVTLTPSTALSGGTNGPIAASNILTIASGNMSAADTITIGSQVFTAETSGATGAQFNIGASALITAQNLAALINSYSTTVNLFSAVASLGAASAGVVTITCLYPGTVGNIITVTKSSTNSTWTHTTAFTGGVDANVVTLHKGI